MAMKGQRVGRQPYNAVDARVRTVGDTGGNNVRVRTMKGIVRYVPAVHRWDTGTDKGTDVQWAETANAKLYSTVPHCEITI
jgi:hypothetical protein